MPKKFVILAHSGNGPLHYDMLLGTANMLPTWQFESQPSDMNIAGELTCRRIADHRAAYLEYEGPISRNRGEVQRVEEGELALIASAEDRWVVQLTGTQLTGKFELQKQADSDNWLFRRLED